MAYVRKYFWNLWKYINMSVRTKPCLRLGMYVVAIESGIQIGLNLCNFGKRTHSFNQASQFVSKDFQSKLQSKAICAIG